MTLLASIRREEEEETADILGQILFQHPNQVVALFPRHMHRINFWQKTLTTLGLSWKLRSAITRPVLPGTTILWDTFGELKAACFHATAAFVGGSLKPLGGQNFLEPVICGAAAVTGPYLDNFNWVGQGLFTTGVVNRAKNSRGGCPSPLPASEYPAPATKDNRQREKLYPPIPGRNPDSRGHHPENPSIR